MRSIQLRLLFLILGVFCIIWGMIGGFLWWQSSSEIHKVFDNELAQIATLIGVISLHEEEEQDLSDLTADLHERGYKFPIIFQAWSEDGILLLRGPGTPDHPISENVSGGFSDSLVDYQRWRVYTLSFPGHVHLVHVAHPYSLRDKLILEFTLNIVKPLGLLIPLLGLLWLGIHRGLSPLRMLAEQISRRDQGNLDPLPTHRVPVEVSVMVDEINALFERLREAIERNNRFTSNAAHELRTPITSTTTHAHAALNATNEKQRNHSLSQMIKGAMQLSHIVDQLLTLARIHPEQLRKSFSPVCLHHMAKQVLSELSTQAWEKKIELELLGDGPLHIDGNEELIAILLRNLVQNAIHATPETGSITIEVKQLTNCPCLQIVDTGPGIPESAREQVFERFKRLPNNTAPGSGLGLSIVKTIMEVHSGTVSLSSRETTGAGLVVTLQFPEAQTLPDSDANGSASLENGVVYAHIDQQRNSLKEKNQPPSISTR